MERAVEAYTSSGAAELATAQGAQLEGTRDNLEAGRRWEVGGRFRGEGDVCTYG